MAPVLQRLGVPVHQNHPEPTREAARAVPRGDLILELCTRCGFLFNSAYDESLADFGRAYVSDQSWSTLFDRHVDALVDRLLADGVRGRRIAEIGCGTGSFLERLCARGDNQGIGFDPAHIGPARSADGRVQFVHEFFRPHRDAQQADVIICRHVLAHIARPYQFFTQIRDIVGARPVRFYFETQTVEWSLQNTVALDFYYEGCSYFSEPSLSWLMRRTGFPPALATRMFDEQYFWVQGVTGAPEPDVPLPSLEPLFAGVEAYRRGERAQLERWRALIDRLTPRGPIAIWGVGAKGVTFLNLLDPECTRIATAIDLNARKQGRFVAGTGHTIEGPEALARRGIASVIVMNPHYRAEIATAVAAAGSHARVEL